MLCPLTQCMPLITNSHDKSIAHRIHDGRWRVCLLGHSYWTFWRHTTLKIGFQSMWWALFNSATVRKLCCLPTMPPWNSCHPASTDRLIAEDKYLTVSFIKCEGKTFSFSKRKDVWLGFEPFYLAKHHKAFISKPKPESHWMVGILLHSVWLRLR